MSRAENRAALWVGAFASCFLLLFHRTGLSGSDEVGVFDQTASLVERGELAVPEHQQAFTGRDGRNYSFYAIGQSVLAAPFYAAGRWLAERGPRRLSVILAGPGFQSGARAYRAPQAFAVLLLPVLLSGALAGCFFLFERLLGVEARWAGATALAVTLTTYLAYMSGFFLRHTAESLGLLAACYCFARFARGAGSGSLLWGSCWASSIFLVRLPAAVTAVTLAGVLAWALERRFGLLSSAHAWRGSAVWRALALLAAPLGAALALHVWVSGLKWGTWLTPPSVPLGSSFGTPLSLSGVANLFSPGSSVFLYSPLLLLAPFGLVAGWRSERALVLAAIANFAILWLFYSRYEYWTGLWSAPGPRYLTAAVPLLLLPLGLWLQRGGRGERLLFFAVAGLGLLIQIALMATSWPGIAIQLRLLELGSPAFPFVFIFEPELSPVLAALRFFWRGQLNDMWLVAVGRGWQGFGGAPGAAWGLGGVWLLALGLCGRRLIEALRHCPAARSPPEQSAADG